MRWILALAGGLLLISLGVFVAVFRTWQYRDGTTASPSSAVLWGVFCIVIGIFFVVLQLSEKWRK